MATAKPVSQYTMDGKFVKTYPSQTAAAKAVCVSVNHIRLASNGYNKTAAGFVWRLHATEQLMAEELPPKERGGINVFQYTLDGGFIKGFRSASSAARELKGDAQRILVAARTRRKPMYGFLWRSYKVAQLSKEDAAMSTRQQIKRK